MDDAKLNRTNLKIKEHLSNCSKNIELFLSFVEKNKTKDMNKKLEYLKKELETIQKLIFDPKILSEAIYEQIVELELIKTFVSYCALQEESLIVLFLPFIQIFLFPNNFLSQKIKSDDLYELLLMNSSTLNSIKILNSTLIKVLKKTDTEIIVELTINYLDDLLRKFSIFPNFYYSISSANSSDSEFNFDEDLFELVVLLFSREYFLLHRDTRSKLRKAILLCLNLENFYTIKKQYIYNLFNYFIDNLIRYYQNYKLFDLDITKKALMKRENITQADLEEIYKLDVISYLRFMDIFIRCLEDSSLKFIIKAKIFNKFLVEFIQKDLINFQKLFNPFMDKKLLKVMEFFFLFTKHLTNSTISELIFTFIFGFDNINKEKRFIPEDIIATNVDYLDYEKSVIVTCNDDQAMFDDLDFNSIKKNLGKFDKKNFNSKVNYNTNNPDININTNNCNYNSTINFNVNNYTNPNFNNISFQNTDIPNSQSSNNNNNINNTNAFSFINMGEFNQFSPDNDIICNSNTQGVHNSQNNTNLIASENEMYHSQIGTGTKLYQLDTSLYDNEAVLGFLIRVLKSDSIEEMIEFKIILLNILLKVIKNCSGLFLIEVLVPYYINYIHINSPKFFDGFIEKLVKYNDRFVMSEIIAILLPKYFTMNFNQWENYFETVLHENYIRNCDLMEKESILCEKNLTENLENSQANFFNSDNSIDLITNRKLFSGNNSIDSTLIENEDILEQMKTPDISISQQSQNKFLCFLNVSENKIIFYETFLAYFRKFTSNDYRENLFLTEVFLEIFSVPLISNLGENGNKLYNIYHNVTYYTVKKNFLYNVSAVGILGTIGNTIDEYMRFNFNIDENSSNPNNIAQKMEKNLPIKNKNKKNSMFLINNSVISTISPRAGIANTENYNMMFQKMNTSININFNNNSISLASQKSEPNFPQFLDNANLYIETFKEFVSNLYCKRYFDMININNLNQGGH